MKKEYQYGLGGILLGLLIGVLIAQNAVNNNRVGMMGMMGMRSQTGSTMMNGSVIDAHFIEQMIPHHEDAITMAKLAEEKAQKAEVKKLAGDIITAQNAEIEQMKSWYKQWYGRELPTGTAVMKQHGMMGNSSGMHMGMMGDQSDLSRLENASDFDKAFVEEMIPHHQMAVMMASMLKGGTQRPEMKKLADDIITAQTKEIDQMRNWLKTW